jgi:hypothetical protein
MFKKDRDAITALSRELSGLKHDIGMNLVDAQAVEDQNIQSDDAELLRPLRC